MVTMSKLRFLRCASPLVVDKQKPEHSTILWSEEMPISMQKHIELEDSSDAHLWKTSHNLTLTSKIFIDKPASEICCKESGTS